MAQITVTFDISAEHQTRMVNAFKVAWEDELLADNGLDDPANITNAMILAQFRKKVLEMAKKQVLHVEAKQAREAAEAAQKADQITLTEV